MGKSVNIVEAKKADVMDWEEKAYHEAGHTLVSEVLDKGSVGFVTTLPSYHCGGRTVMRKKSKRLSHLTIIALVGKEAVESSLSINASGCDSDINKAEFF